MKQDIYKRALIASSVFLIISLGSLSRLKEIENVRAIHFISILTYGVGIGSFLISHILFINQN